MMNKVFQNCFEKIKKAVETANQLQEEEKIREKELILSRVKLNFVTQWLMYLSNQMEFKLFQGRFPAIEVIDNKFIFPLNISLPDGFERQHNALCRQCRNSFILYLQTSQQKIYKKGEELKRNASLLEKKKLENDNQILKLNQAIYIESQYTNQAKLNKFLRKYSDENEQICFEYEKIQTEFNELKRTFNEIGDILNFLDSGNWLSGYYNHQARQKAFVLEVK